LYLASKIISQEKKLPHGAHGKKHIFTPENLQIDPCAMHIW
jgi:hypothetical protein